MSPEEAQEFREAFEHIVSSMKHIEKKMDRPGDIDQYDIANCIVALASSIIDLSEFALEIIKRETE